ncbi:VIT1/CCC1 transporter family protein [Lacibacter sp. MH-610]|uniref:VIT1/CCC1 transporter family protein n=1 Tax=Lacibacter sp. MH-610 TaxID=3020883 RepID=UPI0038913F06
MQSKNIISSLIIGLIDGIRSPLILAATMTFIKISQEWFQWVFAIYLPVSALILGLGHWLTLKSENKSATGEALQKEREIYQNIGLPVQDEDHPQRQPEYITDTINPSIRVALFYLVGGILVFLPFLFTAPLEKALLIALLISVPVLTICSFVKARFYKVAAGMEIVRTTLLPFLAIGLIYGMLQLFQ